MIIKISDEQLLRIKGFKNTFSMPYIKENLNALIPLFIDIIKFNKKYYQNYLMKYYDHNIKKMITIITISPYDFYNYASHDKEKSRILIDEHEYYAYQIYNLLLLPESEEIAKKENWDLLGENESRFHNIGMKGYKNKKYVMNDIHGGCLEAVYDTDGKIVLDHINDGTYNLYCNNNPLHSVDILLWIRFGVLLDRLTMNQRTAILNSNIKNIYDFILK